MGNLSLHSTMTAKKGDREFWRGVLLAGGFTTVPRWTLNPVPGVGEHEAWIPGELMAALRRLANELAVPLSSMLLTVHAKVLGALSGEHEVCTGYASELGSPLPLRMTLEPRSWRELLLGVARAEAELLAHRGFPIEDLRRQLGLREPSFETVFGGGAGRGGELPEHIVLLVAFVERKGQLVLRLRYRTDVLDAECARRMAGYHRTAMALIAADPDAEHARQTLLSAEEQHFQLHGLAGRRRELPERRVHELFEEQVRIHPDAIAAVRGDTQLTYRELNARANQVARALLARGLAREGVVGVVTERSLDWMTAVLALSYDADDTYASKPPRQQGPCHLICTRIELSVRQLSVAAHGRDGVRVYPNLLLEQLVHATLWQLSAASSEAMQLEMLLLGGE